MTRAQEKDIVLMQKGMLAKKQEELKKKPAKLGPSTIRTLIRAADSRKDWLRNWKNLDLNQSYNI